MQAETTAKIDIIKTAIDLLCKHIKYDDAKAQLASLQFLEVQLQKLRNEIAVYQTAQRTYLAALKAEIEKSGVEPVAAAVQPEE